MAPGSSLQRTTDRDCYLNNSDSLPPAPWTNSAKMPSNQVPEFPMALVGGAAAHGVNLHDRVSFVGCFLLLSHFPSPPSVYPVVTSRRRSLNLGSGLRVCCYGNPSQDISLRHNLKDCCKLIFFIY